VPEDRRYAYDMNKVINTIADKNSVLNMRSGFGKSMITAFIRINGRPMGLIANNLKHLAGSLDRDSCDKVARFLQLCDAFGLPIVSLIDAPGFMVGPKTEEEALVRHASRLFIVGANIEVPIYSIVTRKAYGLGAMALAGGSFYESEFTVSWPSGEFGGMGIEGAVKLGFKNELESIEDEKEREAMYKEMVDMAYEHGSADNTASLLEIDEIIDPVDTRKWIINANASYSEKSYKTRKGRYIDAW
jgi:acetyl-CoA carboxylase carboxyltransferase component